jgi:hypothetical protein
MKNLNIRVMALAVGLAYSVCAMAEDTSSESMSKEQYESLENNLRAEYRLTKVQCHSLSLFASYLCILKARNKKDIAITELDANYKSSTKAHYNTCIAKPDADYDVAREKCEGLTGTSMDAYRSDAKVSFNQ